jgi:hypothetical protein
VGELLALLIQGQHRFDASGRGGEVVAPSEARADLQRWTSTGAPPGRDRRNPGLFPRAPGPHSGSSFPPSKVILSSARLESRSRRRPKPWLGPSRLCTRHPCFVAASAGAMHVDHGQVDGVGADVEDGEALPGLSAPRARPAPRARRARPARLARRARSSAGPPGDRRPRPRPGRQRRPGRARPGRTGRP